MNTFGIALILMLCLNFSLNAQYAFKNNLNCDVNLSYEFWRNGCTVCTFGTITVPAGQTVNITPCQGVVDLCVSITLIGGEAPPANHTTMNVCHGGASSASGTTGTNSTCGIINWVSTEWSTFWEIN